MTQPSSSGDPKRPWAFPLQILLGLGLIAVIFWGAPALFRHWGQVWRFWPFLLLVAPLAVTLNDMLSGDLRASWTNLGLSYGLNAVRFYFPLAAILLGVLVLFIFGLAWMGVALFSGVEFLFKLFSDTAGTLPVVCTQAGLGWPWCYPALWGYLLGGPILVWLGLQYGAPLWDRLFNSYTLFLQRMSDRLET